MFSKIEQIRNSYMGIEACADVHGYSTECAAAGEGEEPPRRRREVRYRCRKLFLGVEELSLDLLKAVLEDGDNADATVHGVSETSLLRRRRKLLGFEDRRFKIEEGGESFGWSMKLEFVRLMIFCTKNLMIFDSVYEWG